MEQRPRRSGLEPSCEFFLQHPLDVINRVTGRKPWNDRSCFRFVFIHVGIKVDSLWVMTKQDRGNLVKKLAVLGLEGPTVLPLVHYLGWPNVSKLSGERSGAERVR